MSETKLRILDTARALFNEQGLHRVGVRDVARALGMSPGNLAYHFATKDELVAALVLELHQVTARTVFANVPERLSFVDLYGLAVGSMRHMLAYRFILLSYFDAATTSPELKRLETALWVRRRDRHDSLVRALVREGLLDGRRLAPRLEHLHEQGLMISRGWLVEASFRPGLRGDRDVVLHYAKVGCSLLEPHCTPKGTRQMRSLLRGEHDDAVWAASAPPKVEGR